MLLGLSKIIDNPGASVSFSTSVDLSDLRYGISYPVSEPVAASGTVRNTAGVLTMTGFVRTTIHGICDRCAAAFSREIRFPIDVVLVTELQNEEDAWGLGGVAAGVVGAWGVMRLCATDAGMVGVPTMAVRSWLPRPNNR